MEITPKNHPKVDVVYTWVNGDDPNYQKTLQRYTSSSTHLNPERFRDSYQLLKYSIRSTLQFMPWVNKIHIVTMRPQIPEWLNTTSKKINIVHHDELFPTTQFLPTFNCHTIESYLFRIPNIAPYFIYSNDDYFFGRPLTINDWITKDHKLKIYGTLLGKWTNFKCNVTLREFHFLKHCPIIIHQPSWELLEEKWKNRLDKETRCNKFRTESDIAPEFLYRYFFQKNQEIPTFSVPLRDHLKNYMFCKITNKENETLQKLTKIKQKTPRFFCLNDDQKNNPNPAVCTYVQTFLDHYFPLPSEVEKTLVGK
jgi:hypothetical protein